MTAPKHLRPATKKFWKHVADNYELEPQHVRILTLACEAFDRAEQAREVIALQGPYYTDRLGNHKTHPAVAVERDSRMAYANLLRRLNLDESTPAPR